MLPNHWIEETSEKGHLCFIKPRTAVLNAKDESAPCAET